jgi:hypothetical protein
MAIGVASWITGREVFRPIPETVMLVGMQARKLSVLRSIFFA